MPNGWMVTQGSYSDYRVCAVFTSKEQAERYAEMFPKGTYDEASVETIEIDPLEKVPPPWCAFCVRMDRDGCFQSVEPCTPTDIEEPHSWRPFGDDLTVQFWCFADSPLHAIKIASERRAMLIGTGQWETNFHRWRHQKYGAKA